MKRFLTRENIKLLAILSGAKGAGLIVSLITPILILRYLGAEMAGQLQYLSAFFLLPPVFYSAFPVGLVRFGATATAAERAELFVVHTIFAGAILAVTLALVVVGVAVAPDSWLGGIGARFDSLQIVLVVGFLAAAVPVSLLVDLQSAYTSACGRVQENQVLLALRPLLTLAGLLAVMSIIPSKAWGVVGILATRLAGQVGTCLAFALSSGGCADLRRDLGSIPSGAILPACRRHWRERLRNYLAPLQVTSFIAYVKTHLAVLLMGRLHMLQELAYYDALRQIFDIPRKLGPGFLNAVMPRMLRSLEKGKARFKDNFTQVAWAQFVLMGAIGTAAILGHRPLASLVAAEGVEEFRFLVYLLAVNLLINSQGQSNAFLIQLGEDTRMYMLTTVIRLLVVTLMTLVLVPFYGAAGGAMALILSTIAVSFLTSVETKRIGLSDWGSSLRQAGLALMVCGAWTACLVLWEG